MSKRVTFAEFDAVLGELGFQQRVIPGSHVYYEHPSNGAFLMIRLHKPKDVVPDYVLFGARHDLECQGVIEPARFEEMLNAAAA